MPKISFSNNVIPINQLDRKTRKQIENYYIQVSNNVHLQISQLQTMQKQNTSTKLQTFRLKQLQESIDYNLKEITGQIEINIENSMRYIAATTTKYYLNYMGFDLKASYAYLNNKIITNILTGNLYKTQYGANWEFSKAIWGNYNSTTGDIAKIVNFGIASGRNVYDIAKDLEKYVNPKAKKPWDWSKVYPGVKKQIDYNAQRLARTMISHAYQQSIVECTKNNPFASGIEWRSALIEHRTCELCMQRHGQIYSPDDIPLDHPNGLCTYLVVFKQSKKEMIDEIAEWVKGADNKKLDDYATHLTGFDFSQVSAAQKAGITTL
jgi:SPP1 gp7 family putative phage head morphogenesis protein